MYADSKWVYAEVVAGLAALTCVVYMVPFGILVKVRWGWGWDAVML